MDALITVFYNYSGNDGDKYKLNKGELKQLLNSELTDFLTVTDNIPFEIIPSVGGSSFGFACKFLSLNRHLQTWLCSLLVNVFAHERVT